MAHRHSLFVTTTDAGGTEAVLPVLRAFQSKGNWDIVPFALPGTPAERIYRAHGFTPGHFESYGYKRPDIQAMRVILAEENPSLVLTGIAGRDDSTDRLALDAAQRENIPNAALCETWPNMWLSRKGERDAPLYRKATALIVGDQLSFETAVAYDFDPKRVLVCGNPLDDELVAHKPRMAHLRTQTRQMLGIPEEAVVIAWFGTFDLDNPEHRGPAHEGRFGFGEAEAYREYLEAMRAAIPRARQFGHILSGLFRQKPDYGHVGLLRLERELDFHVPRDTRAAGGSIPTIAACDVICSLIGGTSLRTAAKLGVPGISYQPGATPDTDDEPSNRLGITQAMYEPGELAHFIRGVSDSPWRILKLRRSLKSVEIEPGATARVVREIERLSA
ncbi:hypothetical protein M0Q28_04055 [Patescibacteria group bacterium]|jgi:hypothetical protein|nr:hypothetical protein [Patescibacteria group bacterium]